MAKKISQLTQATQVKSDDVTVIVQDGETKKLPLNMMVTKQDIENKKVAGLAKLDEIEATYENDTYTPTITVKNKSSVKVGEGDEVDYSANVMDGHVKSAILKGQTLVNKMVNATYRGNPNDLRPNSNMEFINASGLARNILPMATSVFEPNKTYTIILFLDEIEDGGLDMTHTLAGKNATLKIGANKTLYTTPSRLDDNNYSHNTQIRCNFKARYMVLDGDYTNVDIPYFTDMQSVKMPVLTTTGKNLLNINGLRQENAYIDHSDGQVKNSNGHMAFLDYIQIPSDKNITFFNNTVYSGSYLKISFYDGDKQFISGNSLNTGCLGVVSPSNAKYCRVSGFYHPNDFDLQLEVGGRSSYEPYKTNILTINEEVELRGIGTVQDELNLLTGELTERIGEIVLDGSENWKLSGSGYFWYTTRTAVNAKFAKPLCDKLMANAGNANYPQIPLFGSITTVDEFKTWLSENNVKMQYQLETESIKTVDLMPSGTHPSTTPYCWKNGHIQLSSSGLLPNLEYSVVTSRAGQINQNATMIVKNDKRIFDLEILLAGGLVNTTYQALTLQNQVETGLSKVSLNSETEPDYLLYHMIMKLIEEKAYKLDDLTEKVSVFYLYEKLSDEQFETIYAALYPFAEDEYFESDIPGDDEVIEEPIVDESLEEVEDEVVM